LLAVYGANPALHKSSKLSRLESKKDIVEEIFDDDPSRTETKLPKIRNPSDDKFITKYIQKQYSQNNE